MKKLANKRLLTRAERDYTWFKKSFMISTVEEFAREILSKESV